MIRDEESAGLMSFQDADRLILIIVKVPILAIRYPLLNGQVGTPSRLAEYNSDEKTTDSKNTDEVCPGL